MPPEHIVTLIIVVVVQTHIGILLLRGKSIVNGFLPGTDTRMVHLRLTGILDKQHVAHQTIETVADPQTVLIALALESLTDLLLGVVLGLQVEETVTAGDKEMIFHVADVESEESLQHTVVDERPREEILTERESEVFYLTRRHRQRWREMAQQSEESLLRDLPYTEKAQYVVDADGVEVLLHPTQALPKPRDNGGRFLPIISGESPVLTIGREIVRRCTCGAVETEELRMNSSLHTLTIDTDRYITLQRHPMLTGIVGSSFQLEVEVVLEVIYYVYS